MFKYNNLAYTIYAGIQETQVPKTSARLNLWYSDAKGIRSYMTTRPVFRCHLNTGLEFRQNDIQNVQVSDYYSDNGEVFFCTNNWLCLNH